MTAIFYSPKVFFLMAINPRQIYSQGLQIQEPQITDRLGISPKLIQLMPMAKESRLPKEHSL